MANVLGRQLWSIYEDLKKNNKIGFLTDEEFQRYFLGFISYKYLSEKIDVFVGNLMNIGSRSFKEEFKGRKISFEEAYVIDKEYLVEESINELGYFLKPDLLFRNIISSKNFGNIIIEELEKAFEEISESSRGKESEEDFLNLFEGIDLNASQLGRTLEDKNRVVFNILDSLSLVDFDLMNENKKNSLLSKSIMDTKNFKNFIDFKGYADAEMESIKAYEMEELSLSAYNDNLIEADAMRDNFDSFKEEKNYSSNLEDSIYERFKDDIIGSGFEYLLSKFSLNSSNSIDYYTPNNVSRLISKLIASQKDHVSAIYDPCCGSASLLLEVKKELPCDFICGQEINASFYNIARENMILHNVHYRDFDIKQGDTLEQPQHLHYKFDAIVSEIPFNSRWTAKRSYLDDVRFREYKTLAPRTKADYAFIQHMLYHLDDDGVMVVVVPHGVLFRAASEGRIREYIIKKLNCLDAVIGLPANMFFSTNIPTCIMIFKKNRSFDDILFIDASKKSKKGKSIYTLSDRDISKIVKTYKNREEKKKYSKRISLSIIEDNDFNLNIPRYVDIYDDEKRVNANDLVREHQLIQEEIKRVTEEIKESYKDLGIDNKLF